MVASIAALLATGSAAGQAEADRADLGVRLGAEVGRAAAEHLGVGAQLDVGLQADHRLESRVASSTTGHAVRCVSAAACSVRRVPVVPPALGLIFRKTSVGPHRRASFTKNGFSSGPAR